MNVSIENQKKKIQKTCKICELISNIRAIIQASAQEKISSNERWLWHVLYSFFGCSAHDPQRAHTLEVAIHSWAKFQKPAKNWAK